MTAPSLVVSEVFGPTIQGEGPALGRRAAFVRLGGCNLACSWCDTPYTWDASLYDLRAELQRRPITDVLAQVRATGARLVVITGGEPLLHQGQPGWDALLSTLSTLDGVDIEVETNGTLAPTGITRAAAHFNVSPKLAHSGDSAEKRIRPVALAAFAGLAHTNRAAFKFVLQTPGDVAEVQELVATYRIPADRVWVMAEGITAAQILDGTRAIAEPAIAAGFNVTTRLHTLIWGQERAR